MVFIPRTPQLWTPREPASSWLFDDAQSEFMQREAAVVTGAPLTMACWYKTDAAATFQELMDVVDDSNAISNWFRLLLRGTGQVSFFCSEEGTGSEHAEGGAYSAGVWQHVAGVAVSSALRTGYLNGSAGTPVTTDLTPTGIDRTNVGALVRVARSSVVGEMSGNILWPAIWNCALTDAEIRQLARGVRPTKIRPQNLVAFWPLQNDTQLRDVVGGYDLTGYSDAAGPYWNSSAPKQCEKPSRTSVFFPTTAEGTPDAKIAVIPSKPEIWTPREPASSWLFDDAQNEYLERASAVLSAAPFTLAAWAKPDTDAVNHCVMCIGHSSIADRHYMSYLTDTPDDTLRLISIYGGSSSAVATTNTYTVGSWNHCCHIEAGTTSRSVILNGDIANKGTDTTSVASPSGIDRTSVGVRDEGGAYDLPFSGNIAWPAIWDVVLTNAEVRQLARGVRPTKIRPQNLVSFWPLQNDTQLRDVVGGFDLTGYSDASGPYWNSSAPKQCEKPSRTSVFFPTTAEGTPDAKIAVIPSKPEIWTPREPASSWLFDDAQNEYLGVPQAAVTEPPFTMGCWFNSDDDGLTQVIMDLDSSGTDDQGYHRLLAVNDGASDPIRVQSRAGGSAFSSNTATAWSANTWHYALARISSSTSREASIDGVMATPETTSVSPAGINRFGIGGEPDLTPERHTSGMIAWPAIWNVALTDAEIRQLARGVRPTKIRPQNLVAFWPLQNDTQLRDVVGGFDLTGYSDASGPYWNSSAPKQCEKPKRDRWLSLADAAPPAGGGISHIIGGGIVA